MSSQAKTLYIPDTLANWPWPREINPHYEEVKADSVAWFHGFKALSSRSQYAFDKGSLELLAALTYPRASKEQLRSGCDLMNLVFVIDEYTDVEPQPVVRKMVDTMIDAMKNPHNPRPQGEVILGEIARQFWESAINIATETAQRHFLESFTAYLESVVQQAADREHKTQHSIASYLKLRHEDVCTRPSFVIHEFPHNLPDDVFYHPAIIKLTDYASELIILDNDMLSYNREQTAGDDCFNILPVIIRELNVDLDGAIDWISKRHDEIEKKFLDGLKQLPSWGVEIDRQLEEYLNGLANWVRGNVCWSFETVRYFGNKGLEVQRTRRVALLPIRVRPSNDASLRRENVVVHLIEDLGCPA